MGESQSDQFILRGEGISKRFGGIRAVDGVSFSVRRGCICGLIGPNGSGKSTLFNIISGTQGGFDGNVYFEGRRINGLSPHRIFELGLGRTFQTPRLFGGMTVLENAMLSGKNQSGENPFEATRSANWEAEEVALAQRTREQLRSLEIAGLFDKLSTEISGGQMKLLQLASVLTGEPKLVLLDEPTAGVAPRLAQDIFSNIEKRSKEKGTTFFIIEHRLEVLFRHVQEVFVMHQGRIIAEGSPSEIVKNDKVIDAYLGR
jgi:branched-chain amino acid transport system ATP-binding protein